MTPAGLQHGGMTPAGLQHSGMTPGGLGHGGMTPAGLQHGGMTPGGKHTLLFLYYMAPIKMTTYLDWVHWPINMVPRISYL